MSSAVANPAFVPLSAAFNISTVQASYELAVYVSSYIRNLVKIFKLLITVD